MNAIFKFVVIFCGVFLFDTVAQATYNSTNCHTKIVLITPPPQIIINKMRFIESIPYDEKIQILIDLYQHFCNIIHKVLLSAENYTTSSDDRLILYNKFNKLFGASQNHVYINKIESFLKPEDVNLYQATLLIHQIELLRYVHSFHEIAEHFLMIPKIIRDTLIRN